ncbi:MAG: hypothetical protein HYV03_01930 [Deltaproteobacteria bacterium]|nr:hypothetical protein [Deltaproteobacteria bacterium]
MYQWTRADILKIFEQLVERDCPLFAHPEFRKGMTRGQNLFANQVIREANGNVAYRSVDFDINDLPENEFWRRIDNTKHADFIEENAAAAIVKMAERFGIFH